VNVRHGFQCTVYQMAQLGVDQGTDPRKLAFQIRNFVVMTPKNPASQAYRQAAELRDRAALVSIAALRPALSSTTACALPVQRWPASTGGQ
jgi:hypothetical protein